MITQENIKDLLLCLGFENYIIRLIDKSGLFSLS